MLVTSFGYTASGQDYLDVALELLLLLLVAFSISLFIVLF